MCGLLDIYVVADEEGTQSVMKIHRFVFPLSLSLSSSCGTGKEEELMSGER